MIIVTTFRWLHLSVCGSLSTTEQDGLPLVLVQDAFGAIWWNFLLNILNTSHYNIHTGGVKGWWGGGTSTCTTKIQVSGFITLDMTAQKGVTLRLCQYFKGTIISVIDVPVLFVKILSDLWFAIRVNSFVKST